MTKSCFHGLGADSLTTTGVILTLPAPLQTIAEHRSVGLGNNQILSYKKINGKREGVTSPKIGCSGVLERWVKGNLTQPLGFLSVVRSLETIWY